VDTTYDEAAVTEQNDQTTDLPDSYRVAVFAVPEDADELLRAISAQLGLNPIDARVRLRHLPGILPDTVSDNVAKSLGEAINRLGVDAEVLAATEIPSVTGPHTVHHVRVTDDGLELVVDGSSELIAWPRVSLVSIAEVPLGTSRHYRPGHVVHAARSDRGLGGEQKPVIGPELWLFADEPFQTIRIDHREMNYEYLGDRLSGSAAANFREFVTDLMAKIPHAFLPPQTRAFVDYGRADKYHFDTREAHLNSAVFHLLLKRRMQRGT